MRKVDLIRDWRSRRRGLRGFVLDPTNFAHVMYLYNQTTL